MIRHQIEEEVTSDISKKHPEELERVKKEVGENLKSMKMGDLEKKLAALREDLRVIKFRAEGAKSKNVKESATLRKQIARVLTAMHTSAVK